MSEKAIGGSLGIFRYNHSCLLLDKDLFEYGANEEKSYERHKDVGRDDAYDWNLLGTALNGTNKISPDQLENAIKNDGNWGPGHYYTIGWDLSSHNCHDFVRFCMDRIGCPASMISKIGPCFKKQKKNKIHIKSALGNKNLDINENKIENRTPIILFNHHGGENQLFNPVYNSDGTVTF